MKWCGIIVFTVIIMLLAVPGEAQYFGKNKVQYESFNWQYLQSEHFDIYFTDGGRYIAEFTAEIAEHAYQRIKKDFRYELVDRITILTYNSHNDFGQTNVDLSPPEESVGGFTEFFKNRVVIPYEGNWDQFRHVIHHELTHAVMLQMLYGSGVQSIITGMARLRPPLWLIEGLAEYESRIWDTESDMYLRDAALNGYVPPVDMLYGFMAYKGGQSVLYYLSEKYGNEKIGELLGKIKVTKSMDKGLKDAIGMDTKELTKKWHMYLKREYWPDIADRKEPEEIGKRMTDHYKDRNFINSGPSISPKGDKIAFLSDRDDYFDIYLMSAIDGKIISKLVSGQRSADLEELHWLRAGISWSPDSKRIVFAAKASDQDALHIVNVKKKKIEKSIKMDLDGVFSPSWSPDGDEIAFMGTHYGQGDIYAYNLKTKTLRQITDDIYSDLDPSWSPDGTQLTFISDRSSNLERDHRVPHYKIYDKNFYNTDVYIINSDGSNIRQITKTPANELSPVFSPDGKKLAYTSDRSGIQNIYLYSMDEQTEYPITNVLTGIFHLSWSGNAGDKLAFASFYYGGYDIYLMKNPLSIQPEDVDIKPTNYVEKLGDAAFRDSTFYEFEPQSVAQKSTKKNEYATYIFDDDFKDGNIKATNDTKSVFLDSTEFMAEGEYKINNYRIRFSPDIVYGNANYSQFFGMQGVAQIALSDVLGNHRINLYTNMVSDLRNTNFQASYFYLPHQIDYGIGGYHYAYYFYTNWGWVRDRYFGLSTSISYPFSRYSRLETGARWFAIDRDYMTFSFFPTEKRRNIFLDASLINDTVLWSYTGPSNGSRSSVSLTYSPGYSNLSLDFSVLKMDYRKYIKVGQDYNFVFRFAGGMSDGKDPRKFFLGGTDGWLNYSTRYGGIRVDNLEDIYFSSFELPLRGASYYELMGNRFALTNIEFRFPFIRYFIMGFPLPIGLQNIRGAIFTDIGNAWDWSWKKSDAFLNRENNIFPRLGEKMFMGYGFGARMNMGFFVLRFDVAWDTDLVSSSKDPKYYFSLGPEF
ncbi:PD40 domain-containing protein [candidate division KSB1 bacterium]|nr:PD40 domain-containing protein [candidate division KSB1 bacterium]